MLKEIDVVPVIYSLKLYIDFKLVYRFSIPQCGGTGTHDSGHQCVDLSKRGVLYVQAIASDAVESRIIQHHYAVRALREPLKRQQTVVWLDHYITAKKMFL